jgi:hypothetical protein
VHILNTLSTVGAMRRKRNAVSGVTFHILLNCLAPIGKWPWLLFRLGITGDKSDEAVAPCD